MILFPNAKINLGLAVTARRPDGYHELNTVMAPAGWCDVLEIVPSHSGRHSLDVSGRAVDCPPEKNLVFKALRAVEAVTGPLPPVEIHLEKIIPDGAGLGGGSADAAFTIRGLNDLLSLGLDRREMEGIAARVGADCPFFIGNTPAVCTGTGTDISPLDFGLPEGMTLVIAKPRVAAVSTAEAYSRIVPEVPAEMPSEVLALPPRMWCRRLVNDFERSIFPLVPQVARVKERMYAAGATYASMSGSGAAVYGIFDDDNLAQAAAASMTDCDTWTGPFGTL